MLKNIVVNLYRIIFIKKKNFRTCEYYKMQKKYIYIFSFQSAHDSNMWHSLSNPLTPSRYPIHLIQGYNIILNLMCVCVCADFQMRGLLIPSLNWCFDMKLWHVLQESCRNKTSVYYIFKMYYISFSTHITVE